MKPRKQKKTFVRLSALACLFALLLVGAGGAAAQGETPAADPADVASVDAIIGAVYDVISGPAGEERDWDRFRSLFVPDAHLIPTALNSEGGAQARVLTVEQFVEGSSRFVETNSFYEREVARRTERYGNIAHAFSTYESRHEPEEEPFERGINSFQLLKDGERWWIVTIYWEAERADNPIPAKYLRDGPEE